ncbi:MAG: Gx transporter family protein [candidate division WOR-3 bacterium]
MPSRDKLVRIAVYAALAIGLYTVDNFLPLPLPWLRLGVGNLGIVLALMDVGALGAIAVFFLKLILGSIVAGRFLTPFFFFALAGGVLGLGAMIAIKTLGRGFFSAVGISCAGGVFHNIGQLLVARFLLIPSSGLWLLAPIVVLFGVISGTFIGILARLVQLRLRGMEAVGLD